MDDWRIIASEQYWRDLKKMKKRYPRETAQMLKNLEKYHIALHETDNPLRVIEVSYVHRESSGCHAITQQPLASAAQTRLYVYCYVQGHELHLICIGDKQSQAKDNKYCKDYVSQF